MALFEDLSKKAGNFAQAAFQKSKEIAETTKLNFLVSGEEDNIKKAYVEIGKIYYEENAVTAIGKLAELCSQITTSNETIKDLREKINEVKSVNICSKCGAEVANTSKFCDKCGTAMPVPTLAPNVICSACGTEINEGSAFCQNCGAKSE